jgi:hypothetical protein
MVLCLLFLSTFSTRVAAETLLGANKFDLFTEFMGLANGCDGSPPCLRITRALAIKAIADAGDAGFGFLRIGIAGWNPDKPGQDRELLVWRTNPTAYWSTMDDMFATLDQAKVRLVPVFVWNLVQFPLISRETFGEMIRNPDSGSRHLLLAYINDFIRRYHGRHTILFYELTNEMNLAADIDMAAICLRDHPETDVCAAEDHFSSQEMEAFSRDMVRYITMLDPTRLVSSGYSAPRPSAWHLANRPGFSSGRPDWTEDDNQQRKDFLARVHEPFGIISVHVYPDRGKSLSDQAQELQYNLISDAESVARTSGKPLFVGEFGDGGGPPGGSVSAFTQRIIASLVQNKVQYVAFWEWEYTAKSLDQDFGSEPENIDPGAKPNYVALLRSMVPAERRLEFSKSNPKPHVVLTWPLPCANVDRPIELSAVASVGAGPVDHVEFLLDGNSIGKQRRWPYRVSFNPVAAGSRKATLEVRGFASDGQFSSYKSPVHLNSDHESCVVPAEQGP